MFLMKTEELHPWRRWWRAIALVSSFLLLGGIALDALGLQVPRELTGFLCGLAAGGFTLALMLYFVPQILDIVPRRHLFRASVESIAPLALYTVAVLRLPTWFQNDRPGWQQLAMGATPVVAVVWLAVAFVRQLRWMDEFQREIELISLACGAGVIAVCAVVLAPLSLAGIVHLPGDTLLWIVPAWLLVYCIVRLLITSRIQ